MEPSLISSHLCEFHTHCLVISLQNSDAHLGFLLLVTLILCFQSELDLIFFIVDDGLNIFLLPKMLKEGLLDHVWVIGGEELGFVGEKILVVLKGLLWLHEGLSVILELSFLGVDACTPHDLSPSLSNSLLLLELLLQLVGLHG